MVTRKKYSSRAAPELLSKMREIAKNDGLHLQEVLEEAMRVYIEEKRQRPNVRPVVMAHHRASAERNRLLGKLLAQ